MRKSLLTSLFAAAAMLSGLTAQAASSIPYLNSPNATNITASGNYLTSFTLTDGTNTTQFNVSQGYHGVLFKDCTDQVIETTPGATITVSALNWNYSTGMHANIYVDYNQDNALNDTYNRTGLVAGGEMVSHSGARIDNNNAAAIESFTLPTDIAGGDYTARFKVAWDATEPYGEKLNGENAPGIVADGGTIADFTIRVIVPAVRLVTIENADPTMGTIAIEGEAAGATSVEKEGAVVVTATPGDMYQFVNWTNKETGAVLTTATSYTYTLSDPVTLVAHFQDKTYPVMSNTFTNFSSSNKQENRYLKSVTATTSFTENSTEAEGTLTADQTLFAATTQDELPYVAFSGAGGQYVENGALIDKTATPVVVAGGRNTINFTFFGWNAGVASYTESELNWTQQALFVDWNNDKDFLDTDENYGKSSNTIGKDQGVCESFLSDAGYSRTITIPATMQPGQYRMRVIYYEPESNNAEAWDQTIFTDKENKIRNGRAYDFVIDLKDTPTSVGTVDAAAATVVAGNGEINVIGNAADIAVYTVGGALVSTKANTACAAGLYIVKVDGKATKVIVK